MAYTSCAAYLGGNIAPNCSDLQRSEFTGEGVIIDLGNVTPTITISSSNPRIIESITLASGDKCAVVDNLMRSPFDGASRALNTEDGRSSWDYSLPIRVPGIDAALAKDVIEPLAKSRFLGIFPTTDGKFFVYGKYGKWQASEQTHNPSENGGDVLVTMTSNEPYFLVELKSTDYAATKAIYDALVAKAF